MIHGVEQPHDFAIDADGTRNPDRLPKRGRHPFGDTRLAVARAPNRNSPRPELIAGPSRAEHLWVDQQVVKRPTQVFFGRMLILERLSCARARCRQPA